MFWFTQSISQMSQPSTSWPRPCRSTTRCFVQLARFNRWCQGAVLGLAAAGARPCCKTHQLLLCFALQACLQICLTTVSTFVLDVSEVLCRPVTLTRKLSGATDCRPVMSWSTMLASCHRERGPPVSTALLPCADVIAASDSLSANAHHASEGVSGCQPRQPHCRASMCSLLSTRYSALHS